ncbi:hypothetical protein CSKR_106972 [Clonorchis sinensis]|uniref:Uncharacterized protein n=1 Tax=Clonorchis sinensis TaxID=79923 RepID=A0A3R7GN68_CLOSI|nr:hypothetical protein CSKR_106972 [Clonorchis sinensis]
MLELLYGPHAADRLRTTPREEARYLPERRVKHITPWLAESAGHKLGDVIPFGHVTNISKDKRYQGVSSELKETRKSPQGSFFDDSLCTLTSLYRFHKLPLTYVPAISVLLGYPQYVNKLLSTWLNLPA